MSYRGDFALGSTFDIKFTSRQFSTGAPFLLAGTPVVAAYPNDSLTQITAGITLTTNFDSLPGSGLNNAHIVATSGNGFATATNYDLVITTGTVDGVSVVGEVVASFSIEARSALRPTTAGRTLDVTATGEAGLDWANMSGQSTSQNLSATTVAQLADKTGMRLIAAGVDDIWDELTSGHTVAGSFGEALAPILSGTAQAGGASSITFPTGAVATAGYYDKSIVRITAGTGAGQANIVSSYAATRIATMAAAWAVNPDATSKVVVYAFGTVPGATAPTAGEVADAVWDEDIVAAHGTADTAGLTLSQLTKRSTTFSTAVVQGSVVRQLADDGAATYDRTTASLQAIRTASITATDLVTAIWASLTSSMTATGSIGKKLADWALGSDNRVLVSANTHTSGETVAAVTGAVGSVTGNVGGNVTGNVTGTVSSVVTKTGYELSTTGLDAVLDRAIAEPAAVFTWPASIRTILAWLGAVSRNKMTQSASSQVVRNFADDANIAAASCTDDTSTTVRDKFV